jgi:hypothetical protein
MSEKFTAVGDQLKTLNHERGIDYARRLKAYEEGREDPRDADISAFHMSMINRAIHSTFLIDEFWREFAAKKATLSFDGIDKVQEDGKDLLCFILTRIGQFIKARITDAAQNMLRDPEKSAQLVAYAMGSVAESQRGTASNPVANMNKELLAASNIGLGFVELVPAVFNREFGGEISAEEYGKIIKSRSFAKILIMMSNIHAVAETTFLDSIGHSSRAGFGSIRDSYWPDEFRIAEKDGEKYLTLNEGFMAKVKAAFEQEMRVSNGKYGIKRGCPANAVRGESSTVIVEFIDWLTDVALEQYVSRVCK